MTQTETHTQIIQTPIFTETIIETQQPTDAPTFTELLQEYIASSPPPAHNTNRLAVGVVPCADPFALS